MQAPLVRPSTRSVALILVAWGALLAPSAHADPNQAPVATACANLQTSLPDPAWMTASATDDGQPTGSVLTVHWSKGSGPGTVTFDDADTYYTYANFSTQGVYVLWFSASDGQLSSSDSVTVTVGSYGNNPPYPSVTYAYGAVLLPGQLALNASISDDGIPSGVVSITWSALQGPGTVTFGDAHSTNTTASFSTDGFYTLRATASDGELQNFSDFYVYVDPASASNRQPLLNKALSGSGAAPTNWSSWGTANHGPETGAYRTPANAWRFTGDGGLYQDVPATDLNAGFVLGFGGYLLTPGSDPLTNGSKHGLIELQILDSTSVVSTATTAPITQNSPRDTWLDSRGLIPLPAGAATLRLRVLCADGGSGSGRFIADDVSLGYGADIVDTGTISNYCALAAIAGRPAAIYKRDGQLIFAANSAADGSGAWTASVIDTNDTWSSPSLAVIGGRPAAIYQKSTSGQLRFAINSAVDGFGAWTVYAITNFNGLYPSLAEVNGRPAVCTLRTWDECNVKWCNPHQEIKFAINSAADGSGNWTVTTVTNGWRDSYNSVYNDISCCALAVVAGRPAIAYNQGVRGIWFSINSAADGSGNWSAAMISTNTYPHLISLAVVAGKPMVACSRYYSSYPRGLYVVAASAADGSGAWSTSLAGQEDNVRWHALAEIDGRPALAFTRGGSGTNTALYFAKNATSDASGAWSRYDLLQDVKDGENCALAPIDGGPAVLFAGRDNTVRYLGSRNASAWDSDRDGMSDNTERHAGTDPFNSGSLLDIMSVARGNANAEVKWRGGTGIAQYLDYRTNLASGSWVCLYSNLPPTSVTNTIVLPNGDTQGFYRIRVEL